MSQVAEASHPSPMNDTQCDKSASESPHNTSSDHTSSYNSTSHYTNLCIDHDGTTYSLTKPSIRIGRGDMCDIRLSGDLQVSTRHCLIQDGVLEDTRSTNGTSINGKPIIPGEQHLLHEGDVILVGTTLLTLYNPRQRIIDSKNNINMPLSSATSSASVPRQTVQSNNNTNNNTYNHHHTPSIQQQNNNIRGYNNINQQQQDDASLQRPHIGPQDQVIDPQTVLLRGDKGAALAQAVASRVAAARNGEDVSDIVNPYNTTNSHQSPTGTLNMNNTYNTSSGVQRLSTSSNAASYTAKRNILAQKNQYGRMNISDMRAQQGNDPNEILELTKKIHNLEFLLFYHGNTTGALQNGFWVDKFTEYNTYDEEKQKQGVDNASSTSEAITSEKYHELETFYKQLQIDHAKTLKDLQTAEHNAAEAKNDAKQYEERLESLFIEIQENKHTITTLENDKNKLLQQVDNSTQYTTQISSQNNEIETLKQQILEMKKQHESEQQELQEQIKILQQQQQQVTSSTVSSSSVDVSTSPDNDAEQANDTQQQIAELQNVIQNKNNELAQQTTQITKLSTELDTLKSQNDAYKATITEQTRTIEKLEFERLSIEQQRKVAYNSLTRSLTKAALTSAVTPSLAVSTTTSPPVLVASSSSSNLNNGSNSSSSSSGNNSRNNSSSNLLDTTPSVASTRRPPSATQVENENTSDQKQQQQQVVTQSILSPNRIAALIAVVASAAGYAVAQLGHPY